MPVILSSALIEREGRVLLARRDPERPPFARQWLLPSTVVRQEESAEEALARHLQQELGLTIAEPVFAETIYLEAPLRASDTSPTSSGSPSRPESFASARTATTTNCAGSCPTRWQSLPSPAPCDSGW